MTFIYGLRCPTSGTIRYVGKADRPQARYRQHLADRCDSRKAQWIRSLCVPPTLVILEECAVEVWRRREARWIERLRARGIDLVNGTPGFGYLMRVAVDRRVTLCAL